MLRLLSIYGMGPVVWDSELNRFPKPNDPVLWSRDTAPRYTQHEGPLLRRLIREFDFEDARLIADYTAWKATHTDVVAEAQRHFTRYLSRRIRFNPPPPDNLLVFPRTHRRRVS